MGRNAYGRPTQRVLPVPRMVHESRPNRNPPVIPSKISAFTAVVAPPQRTLGATVHPTQQATFLPIPVPFYPNGWNNVGYGPLEQNTQARTTYHVSSQNGPILLMNLPVMPEVAGFRSSCTMNKNLRSDRSRDSDELCSLVGKTRRNNQGSQRKIKSLR